MSVPFTIERLSQHPEPADLRGLGELLVDAVASNAAVTFMQPLSVEVAERWWSSTIAGLSERAVVLVARDGAGIAGTVHLQPAWAPNQRHRAEVCKLIVHRRAQGRGMGEGLMRELERCAGRAGFTLLTLDTRRDDTAERLYRRLGWTEAGKIPQFASDPDGSRLHDTVIFYKLIDPAPSEA